MFSNVLNYQAKLISLLSDFLKSQNIGNKTVANYKSDLKHFLLWYATVAESKLKAASSELLFVQTITPSDIESYRNSMLAEKTPVATINRRLSTVRTFGKSLVAAGWITRNPAETVQNVNQKEEPPLTSQELLRRFELYLKDEGAAESTIKSYTADVETFLKWLLPLGS